MAKTTGLDRADLATFAKTPKVVRFFENITLDVGENSANVEAALKAAELAQQAADAAQVAADAAQVAANEAGAEAGNAMANASAALAEAAQRFDELHQFFMAPAQVDPVIDGDILPALTPPEAYSLGAAAIDAATTQALANNLRLAMIANGLGV